MSNIIINPYNFGGPPFPNVYSLDFDGVDDEIEIPEVFALGVTSISFWMKSSHSSGNDSITTGLGNLSIIGTSPLLRQGSANYKYFADQSANLDGNWHHWFILITGSGTLDIDDAKMYVDGVELAAGTIVHTGAPDAWTESKIGNGTYGFIDATIDEFAIWQSDQTSEVSTLSSAPMDLKTLSTPPLAWWRNGDSGTFFASQWDIPDQMKIDNWSSYSMEFDGIDDFVSTPALSELIGESKATWSCWFNTSYDNWQYFYGDSGGDIITVATKLSINRVDIYFDAVVVLQSSDFSVVLGDWNHMMITFDGTLTQADRIKLYLNGVQKNNIKSPTGPSGTVIPSSTKIFSIGKTGTYGVNLWNGNFDEFAITSDVKVASDFSDGAPIDLTGLSNLERWYRMGETATWDGSNFSIPDSSTNSNTGTSQNMDEIDKTNNAPDNTAQGRSVNMDEVDRVEDVPA